MADLSPDEIQMEMRRARRELGADVFVMAEKARVMTDWKYYVRSNPWLCLGAAATLGYLLVPQRLHVPPPNMEPVKELVKATQQATQQAVEAAKPAPPTKSTLFSVLASIVGSTLLQGGMAIASQQVNHLLEGWLGPLGHHHGNGHAGNGHGNGRTSATRE